jgi:hypothetical protein
VPYRQTRTRTVARYGELIAEIDPQRPSGRILRQAGMEASYVDLADATHLEFDYMRWLRIILRATGARRVLHVGGGACALARALAAEDPHGRQGGCGLSAIAPRTSSSSAAPLAANRISLMSRPGRLRIARRPGSRPPTRLPRASPAPLRCMTAA